MANILGSPASDTLAGSSGDDTLSGAGGDDLLSGLAGNDLLDGGDENDTLNGGDGNDRLLGGLGADLLNGDAGNDTLEGGGGDDILNGGPGANSLSGGLGTDLLTGGANADTIDGGDGDDIIVDAQGGGQIAGGAGNDLFRLTGLNGGSTLVDGGDGDADTVESVDLRGYRFSNVERLSLSASVSSPSSTAQLQVTADQVASFNTIIGVGAGGYARFAGGGDFSRVTLTGVVGIDNILGAFVVGSNLGDILGTAYRGSIRGGAGDDVIQTSTNILIQGSRGDASLAGQETIFGDEGDDVITIKAAYVFTSSATSRDFAMAPILIDGGAGIDRLVIGSNSTAVTNLAATPVSGIEILQPVFRVMMTTLQFGAITTLDLRPFDGSITVPYAFFPAQPVVPVGTLPYFEGTGSGLYDFASKTFLNSSTIGFFGGAGSETVIGVSGNDVLAGNDGNDALYGNGGNDSLTGGNGADALFGGVGRDSLVGGDGDDYLNGGADQNSITGGFGLDTLYLDGGRRIASISTSVEFTIIDGTGRHPSLAGTAANSVQSNTFTGIERIAFADGMQVFDTGDAAFLTARLFIAVFARVPDPLGLTEVAQLLRTGTSTVQLADILVQSAEYQLRYPQADNAGFVVQLYDNAMGRAPEAPVLAFFIQELDAGTMTRAAILDYIVRSDEALNRAQAMLPAGLWVPDFEAMEVARLAQATLGRHPDEASLGPWSRGVDAGGPLSDLATLFLASQEYAQQHGMQDDVAFLNTLYANALGRAPDADGLAAWTGALAAGASRGQVAADISESVESKAWNAPWTADGIIFSG